MPEASEEASLAREVEKPLYFNANQGHSLPESDGNYNPHHEEA